jgi:hypothetical protein
MRRLILLVLLGAAIGVGLLSRLPTADGCRASGRRVDPTGRHCLDGNGYVQLREHVIMHTVEVLVLLGIAGVLTGGVWALRRRRSRPPA